MKTAKLSNFYVRSSLFGVLSLTGALFNYALYPILVRVLSAKDFGDFAVVAALSNQVLGILLAFNIISIYLVKTQDEEAARSHAQIIQKTLIWLLVAATILLLVLSRPLHNLLNVEHTGYFVVLALILLTSIPGIIWTGYLQGHKELVRIGGFNLSAAIAKLSFAVLLAVAFGTAGGLLGIICGTIVGLIVLRLMPGVKLPNLSSLFTKSPASEKKFLFGLRNYFIECLFVVGTLSFLQNYDITLAKALFSPETAGVYSGISILSNALYYLGFLLIWVILPEIKINSPTNRRVLGTAYKLLATLSVFVILGEFVLKDFIAKLLLGPSFASQGNLLIIASLYQLTLVGITLYGYYLLVNRQRKSALLAASVTVCCGLVALFTVTTPIDMIRLLWIALLVGLAIYWSLIGLSRFKKQTFVKTEAIKHDEDR